MAPRCFVIGHPIAHSRSPLIHGEWLREHRLAGSYERIDVAPADLPGFIARLREGEFAGGNVTVPHKEAVMALVDEVSAAGRAVGAVNTLWRENGRIIADSDGRIQKMVEHKDANEAERACRLCNSGLMAVKAADLFDLLARVENHNAAGEYYLVDIVNIANADGRTCAVVTTDPFDVSGINSRAELAAMEAAWQARRRVRAMDDGATLIAPETVWFAHDTVLGQDVLIEPNVFFGPGVSVADKVTIRANSHIEGAKIASGVEIGPFARLRPGAVLEERSKIGNFVEMKKARLGKGAKANHLTYLGDADVGDGANVGAGTITCNYDGYLKYRTEIGAGAFIGSNSALVAPVTIGDGAIVAAGSVVTADVHADALAIARGSQEVKPNWAKRFREVMTAKKAEQKK